MYRFFHGDFTDICILSRKIEGYLICFFTQSGCQICKNIEGEIPKLFQEFPKECFLNIDANKYRKIANKYSVKMIPNFVFLKSTEGEPKIVGKCAGGNLVALRKSLRKFLGRENCGDNSARNLS